MVQSLVRKSKPPTTLQDRLHDPRQLSLILTGCVLLVGYGAIHAPLSAQIAQADRRVAAEHDRTRLIGEVKQLREELAEFEPRLPIKSDTNEWAQYIMAGLREMPLNLHSLEPAKPQRLGPFDVVMLRVEVEGEFADLDAFLYWLETNQRMFRVNDITITPSRNDPHILVMRLVVSGITG